MEWECILVHWMPDLFSSNLLKKNSKYISWVNFKAGVRNTCLTQLTEELLSLCCMFGQIKAKVIFLQLFFAIDQLGVFWNTALSKTLPFTSTCNVQKMLEVLSVNPKMHKLD